MTPIRTLLAAAAIACSASVVQAADYASFTDLGVFDDSTSSIGYTFDVLKLSDVFASGVNKGRLMAAHSFESVVQFTLAEANDSNGSATLSNNKLFNLGIGQVVLKRVGSPAFTMIDLTPESFEFSGLSSGTYELHVMGTLSAGFKGGSWGGNLNTQSLVPEPGTWSMLLAGFAGVGFMLRRRPQA